MKDNNDVTTSHSDEAARDDVDMEPVLEALGPRGPHHVTQLMMIWGITLLQGFHFLGVVFLGYIPTYRCNEVNSTQLDTFLGQDLSPNSTVSLEYQKCSIDVTLNTSSTVTTHSLSCVNGINFSMPSDTSFVTEWSLVCDRAGLMELTQTILMLGIATGDLVFASLADKFGRKKVNVCCSLGVLVISSAACLAPNYYVFLVFRMLTGILSTGSALSAYTMFMELVPQRWRGAASCIENGIWSTGCIAMVTIAYLMRGISWRWVNLAFTAGYAYCLLLPCFLDESVRWLAATGNITEVERILQKACRLNRKDFHHVKKVLHAAIIESRDKKQNPSAPPRKATSGDAEPSSKKLPAAEANLGGADTSSHAPQKMTGLELLSVKDENSVKKQNNSASPCNETSDAPYKLPVDEDLDTVDTASDHAQSTEEVGLPAVECKILGDIEADDGKMEVRTARYTIVDICKNKVLLIHAVVLSCIWTTNTLFYFGAMLGSISFAGNRFLNFGLMTLLEGVGNIVAVVILPRVNRRTFGTLCGMVTSLSVLFSVAVMELVDGSLGKTLASVGWFVGIFSVCGSYCVLFVCSVEVFPTCLRSTGRAIAASISRLSGMLAPFVLLMGEDTPWAPGLLTGTLCFLATLSIRLLPETRHRKLPTTVEEIKAWRDKNSHVATKPA